MMATSMISKIIRTIIMIIIMSRFISRSNNNKSTIITVNLYKNQQHKPTTRQEHRSLSILPLTIIRILSIFFLITILLLWYHDSGRSGITIITTENTNPHSLQLVQYAWAAGAARNDNNNNTITNTTDNAVTQSASSLSPSSSSNSNGMRIDITSSLIVHGIAGQFIKVNGTLSNLQSSSASGIAYISIVDTTTKVPIDLEDWSASKGLYIPIIEAGQSLPLQWQIRLVKAGNYTVDILFNKDEINAGTAAPNNSTVSSFSSSPPYASPKITLDVAQKLNLNPGNILPVAFGTPAAIIAALGAINYIRGRKVGVYK